MLLIPILLYPSFSLLTGFEYLGWNIIIIFGILTVVSFVLDWLAATYGVKKMGGSKAGIIGAFIGMIAGLLLPGVGVIGFIVGAFLGAFLLELLVNKESRTALRAGIGSFIGFLAGGVLKIVIALTMIAIFVYQVLFK